MQSSMTLSITGKIAQFGARMIVAVNNKMFDQWAKNFTDLLNEKTESNELIDNSKFQQIQPESGDQPSVKVLPLIWAAIKGLLGIKK